MNVALFADISNLYYCVNKRFEGKKLDYEKLKTKASSFGNLTRAFAYGSQLNDEALHFITCLKKLGYDTKYKKPRIVENAEKTRITNYTDWNVGIAVDIVCMVTNKKADVIIISSANHSLEPLVQWIKSQGIRCIILACGIPKDLKEIADQSVEIGADLLEVPKAEVTTDDNAA